MKAAPPLPTTEQKSIQQDSIEPKPTSSPRTAATDLFVSHLPIPPRLCDVIDTGPVLRPRTVDPSLLTPAAVRLGYEYVTGSIRGGNARCRAMLTVLRDAVVPAAQSREALSKAFHTSFQFWTSCRPHAVSMGNAFTFIKAAIGTLDRDMPFDAVKSTVTELLQTYEQERIEYAVKAICDTANQKLQPRNILTYGFSEAIMEVLLQLDANVAEVVVVDSPPLFEGRRTRDRLQTAGISCRYIDLAALTYVLSDVASDMKVLLGAAALQTDGSITGRIGTAVVALAAHQAGIPVLVCAETYKIAASRGVPLESLTHNELYCDPNRCEEESVDDSLQLLYDLTPASWISGIVTELGLVPPTSVAVLLREMNPHELKAGSSNTR